MGKLFVELLRESVLVQGSIALIIIGTICYLYVTGQAVPNELLNILSLILGFYFGGKVQRQAERKLRNEENHLHNNSDRRGNSQRIGHH